MKQEKPQDHYPPEKRTTTVWQRAQKEGLGDQTALAKIEKDRIAHVEFFLELARKNGATAEEIKQGIEEINKNRGYEE
jgi:hypothetical protein